MEKRERTDEKPISPINDKNHLYSVSTTLIQSDIILFSVQYLFSVQCTLYIDSISLVLASSAKDSLRWSHKLFPGNRKR